MRATLTSLAVLALLYPAQLCLAQDAPPDPATLEAAKEAAKSEKAKPSDGKDSKIATESHKAKGGKGRIGTLSADEAKRAARARKRAAAEFRGRGASVATKAKDDTTKAVGISEPAKASEKHPVKAQAVSVIKEPVKAVEAPPAKAPVQAVDTTRATEAAETPHAREPAKEPVKAAEVPSAKASVKAADTTHPSEPVKSAQTPPSKPADGTPVRQARAPEASKARPRVRNHYVGDPQRAPRVGDTIPPGVRLDPVPRRYSGYGRARQVARRAPPRRGYFVENFVERPRAPWHFMARGQILETYPPYPGAYGGYPGYDE